MILVLSITVLAKEKDKEKWWYKDHQLKIKYDCKQGHPSSRPENLTILKLHKIEKRIPFQ